MFITIVSTRDYGEKCKLDTWLKRTQTNPILPASMAGKIALSEAEGPIELSRAFSPEPCRRGKSRDLLRATSHERLATDCRFESLE
jgi:hypothetical protein